MKQQGAKPKLAVALSMAIWGTLGPFTRQIGVSSGELALYRAILAAAMIGAFLLIRKERIDLFAIRRELLLLFLSGIAMGFNWVLLFQAYKYTTISMATLSYYFAPVLVIAACPLLFREKMSKKQLLCFGMSTLGLVLMIGAKGGNPSDTVGIAFGLGAAVLYTSVILMNKAIREVTGIHRTLIQFLGAIAILIPYVLLTDGVSLQILAPKGWVCLLIVGIVHTGIPYCLYFSSLKELKGQTAAILSYIDPVVSLLVSFFVLHESITLPQLVGGGLILGFTLYHEL